MAIDVHTVRKVARLARIKEPEERLEPLARELSSIMGWIDQLAQVDTDGVEPMTSAVKAKLPLRVRDLRRWEGGEKGKWVIDSGEYTILVGKNADDAEAGTIMGTVTINGD